VIIAGTGKSNKSTEVTMTKPTPAGRYLVAAGQSGEADLYKADFGR